MFSLVDNLTISYELSAIVTFSDWKEKWGSEFWWGWRGLKTFLTVGLEQTWENVWLTVGVPAEVAVVNLLRYSLPHCGTFFRSTQLTWSRIGESKYLVSSRLRIYLDRYNEKTDGWCSLGSLPTFFWNAKCGFFGG